MLTPHKTSAWSITLVCLAGFLGGGLISVYFGKDLSWDLASYHYYNAFSFLHQRWNIDLWPASFIQGYFTPTLDFLTFFLINHLHPLLTTFTLGALHGLNLGLVYCIALLCLKTQPEHPYPHWTALCLSLLGLYGPTFLPGLGSFQHDATVSLFILGFVALQLKYWLQAASWAFLSSCILLGLGIGCKLTAGIYAGGALLAFLFLPLTAKHRLTILSLALLGLTIGLLLSAGYWMLFLWGKYHNPFFPLFNHFFHSPHFPLYNWRDLRFLPQDWLHRLAFPFYFSWNGQTGDLPFRDFRFALLYLLAASYLVMILRKKLSFSANPLAIQWFLLFFLFSYVAWQSYFGIMRYIVSLELLAPLTIYLLLSRLVRTALLRQACLLALTLVIVSTMTPSRAIRHPWYSADYFNIKLPPQIQHTPEALVLLPFSAFAFNVDPRPQNYLIPFFPPGWRFMGIPFWQDHYEVPLPMTSVLAHTSEKNLYLLASPQYLPTLYKLAAQWGFKKHGLCTPITSDRQKVTRQSLGLCLVKK